MTKIMPENILCRLKIRDASLYQYNTFRLIFYTNRLTHSTELHNISNMSIVNSYTYVLHIIMIIIYVVKSSQVRVTHITYIQLYDI